MNFLFYLLYILYFVGVFQLFNIGNFGISPSYPVIAIIYFLFLAKFLANKITINLNPIYCVKSLVLLQVAAGASFIYVLSDYNAENTQFIKTYLHFLFLTSFPLFLGIFKIENKVWVNIIKIWLFLSILINIFGIYQLFARAYDLPLAWIDLTNASLQALEDTTEPYQQLSLKFKNFYRATSIFSEPSALAGYNLTIIGFMIYPMFKSGSLAILKSRKLLNFIFVLSALSLFVTFSLTGVLGLAFLAAAYFIYNKGINYKRILKILLAVIVLIVIGDFFILEFFETSLLELFYTRISSILGLTTHSVVGESFDTRSNNFASSVELWLKSPIIGIGLGQTKHLGEIGYSDFAVMHSLIETGIIGGLIFLSLFFLNIGEYLSLRSSFHKLKPDTIFLLNASFYALVILTMTNFLTSNSFVGFALWSMMGVIFSILTNAKIELGYDAKPVWFFKRKAHSKIERA
ncbi:MAG: O-antigen ligase family protein [Candidatus Kapaibacterium sp.]